jgi:hypothetical protein
MGRRGWIGIGGAAAVAAVALGLVLSAGSGSSAAGADGSYAHDCCGKMVLRDGRMVLGDVRTVGYVVEEDEAGPYLLPESYVGVWEERGFEIDGSRPPVKLRLDRIPKPTTIDVPANRGTRRFERKAFRAPRPRSS